MVDRFFFIEGLSDTGTVLSIHKVVKHMPEHLENLQDFDVTLDAIDENNRTPRGHI